MDKAELLAEIDSNRAKHVAFLQDFIRAPSPNPPGDTRLAVDVIRRYLDGCSVAHSVVAPQLHMPNVVSEFSGSVEGPRLIMNGHIDVFPVGDALGWNRDPWSGDLQDGRVHGRGATDMKAGTAASIIAYTYLYKHRHRLKGSAGLTAVSDEETGGKWGSRWLLENDTRWHGDCMINAEPSGLGTIRFAEKGTLRLTFTVRTSGAHGAYVHRTDSASRLAAALIVKLGALEALKPNMPAGLSAYLERDDVKKAIDGALGVGASGIVAQPTLNVGVINGGLKVNMIPDRCTFEADIRMPSGLSLETVLENIGLILKEFPQAEFAIQQAASNPASSCAHDHPMVGLLAQNAETVVGRRPIAVPSLGATDCKFWRYRKIPAYIYGPAPGRMAMTDECVPVDEFIATLKTHLLSAWDYLGGDG